MRGTIKVARLMGIEVGLHFSWFAIFAVVLWSLGAVYFPARFPAWETGSLWVAAGLATFLFFASVLVHELAHSAAARSLGMEVQDITLFAFGGMASIAREAEKPRHEFFIAVVGPLASFALALFFAGLSSLSLPLGRQYQPLAAAFSWLATINLLLAIFNMIPGFPMDGGRVLRAVLWGLTGNRWLATRVAVWLGRGLAYMLILGGIMLAFSGAVFNAIWLIFVGWFLNQAAETGYRQARLRTHLKGITVNQAMSRSYPVAAPDMTLSEAYVTFFQPTRLTALPVVEAGETMLGIVHYDTLRRIPVERWASTNLREAMTGIAETRTVAPEDDLDDVLDSVDGDEFTETPVVEQGRVVGFLTRNGVLEVLRFQEQRERRPAA